MISDKRIQYEQMARRGKIKGVVQAPSIHYHNDIYLYDMIFIVLQKYANSVVRKELYVVHTVLQRNIGYVSHKIELTLHRWSVNHTFIW